MFNVVAILQISESGVVDGDGGAIPFCCGRTATVVDDGVGVAVDDVNVVVNAVVAAVTDDSDDNVVAVAVDSDESDGDGDEDDDDDDDDKVVVADVAVVVKRLVSIVIGDLADVVVNSPADVADVVIDEFVPDSCSFNVFTSFSASVALCKKTKQNICLVLSG